MKPLYIRNEGFAIADSKEKWKKDEDIRDLRKEIERLKREIAETIKSRGRGRPSKEFLNKLSNRLPNVILRGEKFEYKNTYCRRW